MFFLINNKLLINVTFSLFNNNNFVLYVCVYYPRYGAKWGIKKNQVTLGRKHYLLNIRLLLSHAFSKEEWV